MNLLSNNIVVDPNIVLKKLTTEDLTIRNAPVGGHTSLTAGEQGEPAVVLYERINLSVPVGGLFCIENLLNPDGQDAEGVSAQ